MSCDCEGIRRALISPVRGRILTDGATSASVDNDKVIAYDITFECASLCKGKPTKIVQARIIEIADTAETIIKATCDLYLFSEPTAYGATTGGDLELTDASGEKLVGIIPFDNRLYSKTMKAGSKYYSQAYWLKGSNGYEGYALTSVDYPNLYGVLLNRSGSTLDFNVGHNNLYVELFMEK